MKEIMVRAWEIAREGAEKFGGKASEYIAESLRLAWKEVREPKVVKFALDYGWGRNYVAKINGRHPKWKLDRQFLRVDEKKRSYSGRTGTDIYFIEEDGIYEVQEKGHREYYQILNGMKIEVEYSEVLRSV